MLRTAPEKTNEAMDLTLHLLDNLFGRLTGKTIGVRLWDGTRWPDERLRPVTIVLNHPGALRCDAAARHGGWAYPKATCSTISTLRRYHPGI